MSGLWCKKILAVYCLLEYVRMIRKRPPHRGGLFLIGFKKLREERPIFVGRVILKA